MVAGCILAALVVFFVLVAAVMTYSTRHNKPTIEKAVSEFHLSSQYRLTKSVYDDQSCLDVCAHTVLTYKSVDGQPIPDTVMIDEAKKIGYQYNGYVYQKTVNGKLVHISSNPVPPDGLQVDISL